MSRITLFAIAGLMLALSACSSEPSPDQVRDVLARHIDNGTSERLKLVSFQKLDAQSGEYMGVKVYSMTFRADLEFKDAGYYLTTSPYEPGNTRLTTIPAYPVPGRCNPRSLESIFGCPPRANKGDLLVLSGSAQLEKFESGWKVTGINFTPAQ